MKQVNIEQLAANITSLIVNVAKGKTAIENQAVMLVEIDMKRRVFQKGLDNNNTSIGQYSKKPTYFSIQGLQKQFGSQIRTSALKPKGNPKATKGTKESGKFKNGKTKKSQFFEDGYSGLRDAMGRQTDYVDLSLSGNLENSLKSGRTSESAVLGFTNSEASKLAKILEEDKYKKTIFSVSASELEKSSQLVEEAIDEIIFAAIDNL